MTLANAAISSPKLRGTWRMFGCTAEDVECWEWMDGHFALFMQRQGSKQIDNFIGKTCNEMSKMAEFPMNFR